MGTFSGGVMYDPRIGRGVVGQVLRVRAYGTDVPLTPDDGPVATGIHGGYGRFTVTGHDAVSLEAGGVVQDLVSIEKQLESRSDTSVAGIVATFADLPADPRPGQAFIVQDETAMYVRNDFDEWVGPVPVRGEATDAAVSSLVGDDSTVTRTTLDRAYFTEGDTPPSLPVKGQRWLDTSEDSLMVPSPVTVIGDRWMAGALPPEGRVVAPVGTRYTDTSATAGAVEWIKETGSGNTGWVVAVGDTGWRSITVNAGVTGRILVRRTPALVSIKLENILPPAGTGSTFLATLATGFRHTSEHYFLADARTTVVASQIGLYNGLSVAWMHQNPNGAARPTDPISGEYSWRPVDAWPATLPGTAA